MKSGQKRLIAAALIFVLAVFTAFFLLSGGKKKKGKEEKIPQTKPELSGYTVTISEEAQKTDGIATMALKSILYQKQVEAYGEVLAPDGLSASYKNYIGAISGLEKAKARLKASKQEYARLKVLNANGKNVSDRVLQAAAARLAVDKAEGNGARGALQSIKNAISINWGSIVSDWIFGYKAPLREVIAAKDVLVQLTIPPAASLQGIPKEVLLEPPAGAAIPARFVSRATSTSPRIQGISFIYVASSRSGSLVPGMNVTAHMPSAGTQTGFFVPLSSVVWLNGKAWVYIKKNETGFDRVETPVSTSKTLNGGYFVSGVLSAGDNLVVKGAQALLSEESTPKAAGGGGGKDGGGDED